MGVPKARIEEIRSILTEKLLRENYVNKRLSIAEVAKLAGCSDGTVSNYLRKFNILRRSTGAVLGKKQRSIWRSIFTKEFLERRYLKEHRTFQQIAAEVGCDYTIVGDI